MYATIKMNLERPAANKRTISVKTLIVKKDDYKEINEFIYNRINDPRWIRVTKFDISIKRFKDDSNDYKRYSYVPTYR